MNSSGRVTRSSARKSAPGPSTFFTRCNSSQSPRSLKNTRRKNVDKNQPKIDDSLKISKSAIKAVAEKIKLTAVIKKAKAVVEKAKPKSSKAVQKEISNVYDDDEDNIETIENDGEEEPFGFDMLIGETITAAAPVPKKNKVDLPKNKNVEIKVEDMETKKRKLMSKEDELEILKEFDLDIHYGPCSGITRSERLARAIKYDVKPVPQQVIAQILKNHKDESIYDTCIWDQYKLLGLGN